jgi:hypothetical protein
MEQFSQHLFNNIFIFDILWNLSPKRLYEIYCIVTIICVV